MLGDAATDFIEGSPTWSLVKGWDLEDAGAGVLDNRADMDWYSHLASGTFITPPTHSTEFMPYPDGVKPPIKQYVGVRQLLKFNRDHVVTRKTVIIDYEQGVTSDEGEDESDMLTVVARIKPRPKAIVVGANGRKKKLTEIEAQRIAHDLSPDCGLESWIDTV
jgi:hypothetical protein